MCRATWKRRCGFARQLADQGHAEAQFSLGNMFYEGRGVAQNIEEGRRLFRKAADQGHLHAQFLLASGYTIRSADVRN